MFPNFYVLLKERQSPKFVPLSLLRTCQEHRPIRQLMTDNDYLRTCSYFAVTVIYRCRKCSKTYSALDEDLMVTSGLVSGEIYFSCPIRVFRKSCWTTSFLNMMCDLVISSGCSMKSFINAVARARRTRFLKSLALYHYHCQEYNKLSTIDREVQSFSDFGSYFNIAMVTMVLCL